MPASYQRYPTRTPSGYLDADVGAVKRLVYNSGTGQHVEQKPAARFIKGPIPFDWQAKANALPGKAGQVGIALWFLAGVKGKKTVAITREVVVLSGCTRQTFAKSLGALEAAGLIVVERHTGRRPVVTVMG